LRNDELSYAGPLVEGVNEIFGDMFFLELGWDSSTAKTEIIAVVTLPDDRTLFAFEAEVEYETQKFYPEPEASGF
jgi:hypothetical protein